MDKKIELPTLDEFLIQKRRPYNGYIDYPGFSSLYLRKGDIGIQDGEKLLRCGPTIHVANVTSEIPGNGAFARLVKDLMSREFAVYVECVHNLVFVDILRHMGFKQINQASGTHFIKNHENKLTEWIQD